MRVMKDMDHRMNSRYLVVRMIRTDDVCSSRGRIRKDDVAPPSPQNGTLNKENEQLGVWGITPS